MSGKEQKPGIYTVTLNPSLDYIVSVKDFRMGRTNRTAAEQLWPGGKGLNVSTVLCRLGFASTAFGFCAGFVGEEIERQIKKIGFACDFIRLAEGCSRINVKLKEYEGTEINGMGPFVSAQEKLRLMEKLAQLRRGDLLVLAGSVPRGLSDSVYQEILEQLKDRGILAVVDASGELLLRVLPYRPFLIKPNRYELEELFGVCIGSRRDAAPYAEKLRALGAQNVLVSLGGEGALLASADGEIRELAAPAGRAVNPVGAGDSMLAGFLAGWLERRDYRYAFRLGVSAGSASAFSEGLAEKEEIRALYETVEKTDAGY